MASKLTKQFVYSTPVAKLLHKCEYDIKKVYEQRNDKGEAVVHIENEQRYWVRKND